MKHGNPDFMRSKDGPDFVAAKIQDRLKKVSIPSLHLYSGSL
ncbi:hypothetical protein OAP28_05700 [Planktomarina sp.]|nr:hypothetical protein [Planktomarina sp.]